MSLQQSFSHTGTQPVCHLCGLMCPDKSPEKTIRGEFCRFCCAGCLHVYEILTNLPEGPPGNFRETDLFRDCMAAGIIPKEISDIPQIDSQTEQKQIGRARLNSSHYS